MATSCETRCKVLFISIYLGIIIFTFFYLSRILTVDQGLFSQINNFYNPGWNLLFLMITYAGSTLFWIFATIYVFYKKKMKLVAFMIFALIIDTILITVLKGVFLRPRPGPAPDGLNFLIEDVGSSFPSGHAERAFSGAVIIGSIYKNTRIPLFILAIIVAFSRIYLGVHYPLDVFYGAFNGVLVGMLCLSLPVKGFEKKLNKVWKKLSKF